jgi:predicted DNA-binding protein (MmcQ/YjbR family)
VVKVRGKVFVFLGRPEEGGLGLSVKLPGSATLALDLPFATPTGYGLGKSGWVTARFPPRAKPPLALLKQWIDESYRAVAPKRLVAQLVADALHREGAPLPRLLGSRSLRRGGRRAGAVAVLSRRPRV